jgi:hypothetical protein
MPSTLTLHIDALGRGELLHLQRLLKRLAPKARFRVRT